MSLAFVIDMNLSAEWILEFASRGWTAVHWSTVGDPKAPDAEIMQWAQENDHIVFTHDLDFGTALALTNAVGPSVLQIRSQFVLPEDVATLVIAAVEQYQDELSHGALVVVQEGKLRVRVLPFN